MPLKKIMCCLMVMLIQEAQILYGMQQEKNRASYFQENQDFFVWLNQPLDKSIKPAAFRVEIIVHKRSQKSIIKFYDKNNDLLYVSPYRGSLEFCVSERIPFEKIMDLSNLQFLEVVYPDVWFHWIV